MQAIPRSAWSKLMTFWLGGLGREVVAESVEDMTGAGPCRKVSVCDRSVYLLLSTLLKLVGGPLED